MKFCELSFRMEVDFLVKLFLTLIAKHSTKWSAFLNLSFKFHELQYSSLSKPAQPIYSMKKDPAKFIYNHVKCSSVNDFSVEDLIQQAIKKNRGNTSAPFFLTNHETMEFAFISNDIKRLTGYSNSEFRDEILHSNNLNIHPDDFARLENIFEDIFRAYYSISIENKPKYRFCIDYRLKKKDEKYIWILHEFKIIKTDKYGRPFISFSQLKDITSSKCDETLNFYMGRYDHQGNYKFLLSNKYPIVKQEFNLSHRELEILKLISEGFVSKQIADKLNISLNTVNTHRQNMLFKGNASTSSELVNNARLNGLI